MTDPLPDWFRKLFAERQEVAVNRLVSGSTTEQVWEAKGRIAAFLDIKAEIDMVESAAAQAEREALERYTSNA